MASVAEFNVTPEQQGNVRLRQALEKRSGAYPYGWRQRFFVLAGNMLFEYNTQTDTRPKKSLCVDRMVVEVSGAVDLWAYMRQVQCT